MRVWRRHDPKPPMALAQSLERRVVLVPWATSYLRLIILYGDPVTDQVTLQPLSFNNWTKPKHQFILFCVKMLLKNALPHLFQFKLSMDFIDIIRVSAFIFRKRVVIFCFGLFNGRLRSDNNLVENAIRTFVLGRKNWLFSGHPRGADASVAIFSLIETAKAKRLEPYTHIRTYF